VNGFARNYVARLLGGDSAILNFQLLSNQLVLTWTNAGFNLQSAPALTGPFTNLSGTTSPFNRPFGTRIGSTAFPALKRRAILVMSLRDPAPRISKRR
jgi:hypothetical protein